MKKHTQFQISFISNIKTNPKHPQINKFTVKLWEKLFIRWSQDQNWRHTLRKRINTFFCSTYVIRIRDFLQRCKHTWDVWMDVSHKVELYYIYELHGRWKSWRIWSCQMRRSNDSDDSWKFLVTSVLWWFFICVFSIDNNNNDSQEQIPSTNWCICSQYSYLYMLGDGNTISYRCMALFMTTALW